MVSGWGQGAHCLPSGQRAQQPSGHLEEEQSPRLEAVQPMSRHEASSGPVRGAGPSGGSRAPRRDQVQPGASALSELRGSKSLQL